MEGRPLTPHATPPSMHPPGGQGSSGGGGSVVPWAHYRTPSLLRLSSGGGGKVTGTLAATDGGLLSERLVVDGWRRVSAKKQVRYLDSD